MKITKEIRANSREKKIIEKKHPKSNIVLFAEF